MHFGTAVSENSFANRMDRVSFETLSTVEIVRIEEFLQHAYCHHERVLRDFLDNRQTAIKMSSKQLCIKTIQLTFLFLGPLK